MRERIAVQSFAKEFVALVGMASMAMLIPVLPVKGEDAKSDTPKATIRVIHDSIDPKADMPRNVFVTLYQHGKAIRTAELRSAESHNSVAAWTQLPLGEYELHMEARGFKKTIKRVILSEDDRTEIGLQVYTELDRNQPLVFGRRSR